MSCAEAGGALDGAAEDAEDAYMDGILNNEELEPVFESICGAEDSGRLESVKRGAGSVAVGNQEADRRTVQVLTFLHQHPNGLAGRSIPLNGAPFRLRSRIVLSEASVLIERMIKSTRKLVVEPP